MKIAVTGANGQLGSDICKVFKANGHQVIELNKIDGFDLENVDNMLRTLAEHQPSILINTAAFLNVELCEREPNKAYAVNATGTRNLAKLCNQFHIKLIHISTDYVFDGKKNTPYVETDCINPLNVYGNSKAAGDYFVQNICQNYQIIRVSAIYGKNPCRHKNGLNFVELMLKLAKERPELRVVDNEYVSPTHTLDIARQLLKLSQINENGIYHCTSEGECSWYEFAKTILDIKGIKTPVQKALPNEFPMKAPRPLYSVLENAAMKKLNINEMPHWKKALEEYLKD